MSEAAPVELQGAPRARLPRVVLWLGVVSLLNDIGTEAIYPLLPLFLASTLHAPRQFIGAVEGAAEATASLLKLVSGRLTDRMARRKPFAVLGYAISGVVRPLVGLSARPWQVLLARLGDRMGKGLRAGPRDALLADATPRELRGRAFGFHEAMDNAGAVLGPLFATALLALGLSVRGVFLATALPGAVVLLTLSFGVHEAHDERPHAASGAPMEPAARRALARYLIALALFGLGNSSDAFLLLHAAHCGVAAAAVPLLWMIHNLTKASLGTWAGALSDRRDRRHVVVAGWTVYALVYFGFGRATRAWQVWPLFVAYGLYYAFVEGAMKAIVADLVPPAARGRAFGWYHAVIGVVALPASLAFGAIADRHGIRLAFTLSAVLAGAGALWLLLMVRPRAPA